MSSLITLAQSNCTKRTDCTALYSSVHAQVYGIGYRSTAYRRSHTVFTFICTSQLLLDGENDTTRNGERYYIIVAILTSSRIKCFPNGTNFVQGFSLVTEGIIPFGEISLILVIT